MKKLASLLMVGVLSLGVLTACGEPDPLEPTYYKTVPMEYSINKAQRSIVNTAVRYFYSVNNDKFEDANLMIDRTDLSVCTPEILKELYSNVENYPIDSQNRVIDVDVNNNTATVTFINLNDDDHSFDPSYSEEDGFPPWYGMSVPYVPDIAYANSYEIQDVNEDGVIDETDMMWEDHPELNPDYEPPEEVLPDDTNTTATGARVVTYVDFGNTLNVQPMAVDIDTIAPKSTSRSESKVKSKVESKVESKADVSKVESKADVSKVESKADANKKDGVESSNTKSDVSKTKKNLSKTNSVSSTVEQSMSDIPPAEDDKGLIDGFPADILSEQKYIGYKTYKMDITVNKQNGVYKVQLPSTMTTSTRLMIKVPDNMYIKVGDLSLDKSMMNLDDFYVINKLPKVRTFDITLENLILGSSKKTIDLTERVYYIYSNLVPTREMKDEVLNFAKPALQSLYSSMLKGVDFARSTFYTNYVSEDGDIQNIHSYYDKYILDHKSNYVSEDDYHNETYEVISTEFPPSMESEDADFYFYAEQFRVTSYYYVDVPLKVTIRQNTTENGSSEINITEIFGTLKLTKKDGKWYVWDISKELLLSE